MLERPIARVMLVAVDIRLDDLLDLVPRQLRRGRPMIGAADQHLAGPDRVALPEAALAMLLPFRPGPDPGKEVGPHPAGPPPTVGRRPGSGKARPSARRTGPSPGQQGPSVLARD